MANYWMLVKQVIAKSDIILLVLDARLVAETRNIELERRIQDAGKKIIYVMNKCDLVQKDAMEAWQKKLKGYGECVFVSARDHLGTTILKRTLLRHAKPEGMVVGVVGYPNTGKSSVINALKGRGSAKVSSISGYTRGLQRVNIGQGIMLIDTPGVLSWENRTQEFRALIGSLNPEEARDPEAIAFYLLEKYPHTISMHYRIERSDDLEEFLERIAIRNKKLLKGGVADTPTASRMLIKDWQNGKIMILEEETTP